MATARSLAQKRRRAAAARQRKAVKAIQKARAVRVGPYQLHKTAAVKARKAIKRKRRPAAVKRRRAVARKVVRGGKSPAQLRTQAVVRAAKLMPKSPARLRDEMLSQRRKVRKLETSVESILDRRQKAQAKKVLQSELRILASLVTAAKTKKLKKSGKVLPAAQVKVSAAQSKLRKGGVAKQIPALARTIRVKRKSILKLRPGPARAVALTSLHALEAQHKSLRRRYLLLSKGRDQYRAKALRPGAAKISRKPLVLPASPSVKVDPGVSTVMVRLLSSRIPRREGEDRRSHNNRLRSYTKRAMVRYVKAEQAGIEPAMASQVAVVETLAEDMPALEAEADAGGTTPDAAADAMEENVTQVESQLEEAALEAAPQAAAKMGADEFVSPEIAAQVQADLATAAEAVEHGDGSEVIQAEAEIAADELASEDPTLFDVAAQELLEEAGYAPEAWEDEKPWWQNPYVIGAGALVAVVLVARRK